MLKFDFQNSYYNITLRSYDKYVFITGESGNRKSQLFSDIEDAIYRNAGIECNVDIKPINIATSLSHIEDNSVYIVDEYRAHDVLVATKGFDCYVIAITRKVFRDFNFSYRCFYKIDRSANPTVLQRMYNFENATILHSFAACEDSGYGLRFFRKYLRSNVESFGNKSNLKHLIKALVKIGEPFTVIMDGGGLGSESKVLHKALAKHSDIITVILPECFEEFVLQSDFVQRIDTLPEFTCDYDNTENYCELLSAELTMDKPYVCDHAHGILSECYFIDCSECAKCTNCKYRVTDSKATSILHNTILRFNFAQK